MKLRISLSEKNEEIRDKVECEGDGIFMLESLARDYFSEALTFARAIEREAYKQGQERMRERTSKTCLSIYEEGRISSLEIEEPK